jgi:hypothetical protein
MSVSVTCVYTINAAGQMTPAQLAAAMSAPNVPIPPDFLTLTGATVTSDNSVPGAGNAVRTVVFNITSAQFQAQFPVDAASPFLGLLTLPIGLFVNAPVVESFPLVA